MELLKIVLLVLVWIVSAIPLNIAVKMLGGKSSIIKVIAANILVVIIGAFLQEMFGFIAVLLSFVAMLFIYKILFRIGWLKAFFAWILQFVLIVLFIWIFLMLGLALIVL